MNNSNLLKHNFLYYFYSLASTLFMVEILMTVFYAFSYYGVGTNIPRVLIGYLGIVICEGQMKRIRFEELNSRARRGQ